MYNKNVNIVYQDSCLTKFLLILYSDKVRKIPLHFVFFFFSQSVFFWPQIHKSLELETLVISIDNEQTKPICFFLMEFKCLNAWVNCFHVIPSKHKWHKLWISNIRKHRVQTLRVHWKHFCMFLFHVRLYVLSDIGVKGAKYNNANPFKSIPTGKCNIDFNNKSYWNDKLHDN